MGDNVTKFPEPPKMPELLCGPFETYRVVVDGKAMPLLSGFKEGNKIWLVADGRFACGPFDEAQAHQAARLAGECMAVMAGYPNLRADTKKQPFAPTIIGIDSPGGSA